MVGGAVTIAVAGLLLTACAGDELDASPTSTASAVPNAALPADEPVLIWTSLCYGTCLTPDPPGMPRLVVYGDGRVVRSVVEVSSSRDGGFAEGPARVVVATGSVGDADLSSLLETSAALGLVDGADVQAGCPASEGHEVIEVAGGSVAGGRLVTWLLDEPPCPGGGRYAELVPFRERLLAIDASATIPATDLRWTMLAQTPLDLGQGGPAELPVWAGPDPAPITPNGAYGERCAILDAAALAAIGEPAAIPEGQAGARHYAVGDATWRIWVRPMLPHELTCVDVAATVSALAEIPLYVE